MTLDCSCNRLVKAELKAKAMENLLDEALEIAECQPGGFFKCLRCEYNGFFRCLAFDVLKEKKRIIKGDTA